MFSVTVLVLYPFFLISNVFVPASSVINSFVFPIFILFTKISACMFPVEKFIPVAVGGVVVVGA